MEQLSNVVKHKLLSYLDLLDTNNLYKTSKTIREQYRNKKHLYPRGIKTHFREQVKLYRILFKSNPDPQTILQYITSNVKNMEYVGGNRLDVLSTDGTIGRYYILDNNDIERTDLSYRNVVSMNSKYLYYADKVTDYDNNVVNYKRELPRVGLSRSYYDDGNEPNPVKRGKFISSKGDLYIDGIKTQLDVYIVIADMILFKSGRLQDNSRVYFKSGIVKIAAKNGCILAVHENGKLYIYGEIDKVSDILNLNTIREFGQENPDILGYSKMFSPTIQSLTSADFLQYSSFVWLLDFVEIPLPVYVIDIITGPHIYILTL